ncbi:MAG TPA: hypothetical protein VE932_01260 [Patescibacteria group bacterium]|nr:hypothetical protein [Patescibacteria group bacterium]
MTDQRHDDLTPEARDLLARAAAAAPPPPEPHWGDYRAQLRARLQARRSVGARLRGWWARPAPIALTIGLAAALLLFTLHPVERRPDLAALDEAVLGARLELLEHYRVVERLDLLEELDVIRQLDRVPTREG